MIKQIVGFQRVEYDKKDGSGHVSGANLYIAVPIPEDRGSGLAVERVYVGSKNQAKLKVPFITVSQTCLANL